MSFKITDTKGRKIPYDGLDLSQTQKLVHLIDGCLKREEQVLICITGNKGVGKTTLGKFFRKKGLGTFRPRDIAVIDDDCMSVDVLCLFRRKYVNPCRGVDELRPFLRLCRRKKVRFYIKSNPESRISRADIVLAVSIDENKRKARLIQRYGEPRGSLIFEQTVSYTAQPAIAYQHWISAELH